VRYLLDTCAVSELIRPKPNPGLVAWLSARDEPTLALSVLTLGEIRKGIAKLPQTGKRNTLEKWLNEQLIPRFAGRILSVTADVALVWGDLQGQAARRGTPLPVLDALIAATAIVNECAVITRDEEALRRCGAEVMNPWT
jgi:predicted nucleic acid-binding protein